MPCDRTYYPSNWEELSLAVKERAGWRCEGSPAYPTCRAEHRKPHPVTGKMVFLAAAHLYDDDCQTQDISRLRAWGQRCHNRHDAAGRARWRTAHPKNKAPGQGA